jgi:DNA-binding NtrC family response regulator
MRRLMSYSWPGNVRQLENTVERALAFGGSRGQMEVSDLPPEFDVSEPAPAASLSFPDDGVDLAHLLAEVERDLIRRSLERTGGNKGRAARLLRINRTTLVEKLKRLGY